MTCTNREVYQVLYILSEFLNLPLPAYVAGSKAQEVSHFKSALEHLDVKLRALQKKQANGWWMKHHSWEGSSILDNPRYFVSFALFGRVHNITMPWYWQRLNSPLKWDTRILTMRWLRVFPWKRCHVTVSHLILFKLKCYTLAGMHM